MEKTAKGWLIDIAALWIPVVFLMMTFFVDSAYFNMLEAKAYVFQMSSVVYIAAVGISVLLCYYYGEKIQRKRWNLLDWTIALFMVVVLISSLTSEHRLEAFTGEYGWSVGGIYLLTCGVIYYLVSRFLVWTNWMALVIKASGIAVFVWTTCDIFYLDMFKMHHGIVDEVAYNYVASIGNVNWFAGYLALILPFYFYGLREGKKWERILSGIGLFLGVFAGVNCNADSVFLGLGVLLVFSLLESIGNRDNSISAGIGWIIVGMVAGVSDGLRQLVTMIELEGIAYSFVEQHLWIGVMLGGLLLTFLPEINNKKGRILLRVGIVGIMAVVIGFLAVWQLGQFDDSWGTNRGGIWRAAMDGFMQGNLKEKILGVGPDCFGYVYASLTGSDWVRNAHNEYLQYLVTTGIMGGACYVGIYIASIYQGLCGETEGRGLPIILMASILSYGAQAVVNNPQALNGAIFITLLAIFRQCGIMKEEGKNETFCLSHRK